MLQIMPYTGAVNFQKLNHGPRVFHDALEAVLKGEKNFQVINPDGENYCLHYIENIVWAKQFDSYPNIDIMDAHPFYRLIISMMKKIPLNLALISSMV